MIEVSPPRKLELGGLALALAKVGGDPTMEARNLVARREVAGTIGLVVRGRYAGIANVTAPTAPA